MLGAKKQIAKFFDNIEGASEFFCVDDIRSIHTCVNTNNHFPKYHLEIIFHNSFVHINTTISDESLIISNQKVIQSLSNLFDTLNLINKNGHFFVDINEHKIMFMSLSYLDDIINADNPWLVIFCGIETINFFSDSIQAVLDGSNIFYVKQTITT